MSQSVGVYIHIPFCRAICPFCNLATARRSRDGEEAYLGALTTEISEVRPLGNLSRLDVDSIYFGGGTPSVLEPDEIQEILKTVHERFEVDDKSEVTIEVDPGTANADKLAGFKDAGINRISVGGQSLNTEVLRAVGRQHGAEEIFQTFDDARKLGFVNFNLDLMVGLPGEDLERDLVGLDELSPEHVSVYILDVADKVPRGGELLLGNQPLPDEVHTLDSYSRARDVLQDLGLRHYEVSNYALPGWESRHNLKYSTDQPYIGFGASAHSYLDGTRLRNVRSPTRYVERMASEGNAVDELEPFDAEVRAAVLDRYGERLRPFMDLGLIEESDGFLKLTESGVLVSNEILNVFL